MYEALAFHPSRLINWFGLQLTLNIKFTYLDLNQALHPFKTGVPTIRLTHATVKELGTKCKSVILWFFLLKKNRGSSPRVVGYQKRR